jgi:hypothetical protein
VSDKQAALRTVEQAQKQAAERAQARVAAMRRQQALREAERDELVRKSEALSTRIVAARAHSVEACDVQSLRWAHDHTQALEAERRALVQRVAALEAARLELARAVRMAERAFREAAVARRAVGTVLERREQAEQRARELGEEELLADAMHGRPR